MFGQDIDRNNPLLMEWINKTNLEKNIHLLGPQQHPEKILQGLDIFVSASSDESLPLAVAEAMSCSIPCVVTDVGDQKELVGDSGIVVNPGSLSQLNNGCSRILEMSEFEKQQLGRAARTRILENYSFKETANQYLETYKKLVSKHQ